MQDVAAYLLLAIALNVPAGMIRTRFQKLSVPWFVAIHAFIPFLLAFRLLLDVSWVWIPLGIACAVAAQIVGTRLAPAGWKAVGDALNAERDRAKAEQKQAEATA